MKDVVYVTIEGFKGLEVPLAGKLTERLVELGAIAVAREGSVALDLSVSWAKPSPTALFEMVRNALQELGVSDHCRVEIEGEVLRIFVTDPQSVKLAIGDVGVQNSRLHVCPHCGYATLYEELLKEHVKLHYIGV
ncbi:MAG: hypothetical protein NZ988_03170 [Thaumarchaeota archaeon]|nr:hypothetical protein [Candidatus Calditenuaceae archaeon]MDW8187032.1 hypothetical protein [Nitrososphaerota archaeon]